jgi:hypothetical protein
LITGTSAPRRRFSSMAARIIAVDFSKLPRWR